MQLRNKIWSIDNKVVFGEEQIIRILWYRKFLFICSNFRNKELCFEFDDVNKYSSNNENWKKLISLGNK